MATRMKRQYRKKHTKRRSKKPSKRRSKRGGVLGDPERIRVFDEQLNNAEKKINKYDDELKNNNNITELELNETKKLLSNILGKNVGLAGWPVQKWKQITWRDQDGTIKTYTPWIGDGVNSLQGIQLWAQGDKSQNPPIYLDWRARDKRAKLLTRVTNLYHKADELYNKYKEKLDEVEAPRKKNEEEMRLAEKQREREEAEATENARRAQLSEENQNFNKWHSDFLNKINNLKTFETLESILNKEQTIAEKDSKGLKFLKNATINKLRETLKEKEKPLNADELIAQEAAAAEKAAAEEERERIKQQEEEKMHRDYDTARYGTMGYYGGKKHKAKKSKKKRKRSRRARRTRK